MITIYTCAERAIYTNHVHNQSRGHAKKVESACPQALKQIENCHLDNYSTCLKMFLKWKTAINFTFLWSVRLKHRFKPVKPHLRIPSGHAKITGKSCMYLSIRTVRLRVCRSVYICLWLECYVLDLTTSKFWALIERYISDMIYSYCSRHNYQQVHETKCKIHLVKFCISISNQPISNMFW